MLSETVLTSHNLPTLYMVGRITNSTESQRASEMVSFFLCLKPKRAIFHVTIN